jgi:hypothetical protein
MEEKWYLDRFNDRGGEPRPLSKLAQPSIDGASQLVEFAGKEMIHAFDDNKMVVTR